MRKDLWRNFNGPGKPITLEQIDEILSSYGVEKHFNEKGEACYRREDVERAFKHVFIRKQN